MAKPKSRPLLSIGMIFKNEIRCLERCLKSLAPLREAIPCELVMADTGADDGSREVAEKYADILFDFPWINDFAAARNAVMDRCSGQWFMTIDADEWFDDDCDELIDFLQTDGWHISDVASLIVRNHNSSEISLDTSFADFVALRILRMSLGVRYVGIIHEYWPVVPQENRPLSKLSKTILHHDGYIGLNTEKGKAKRDRNLSLLRKQLDSNPKDLRALMQYIESGQMEPDYMEYLHRAVEETKAKGGGWQVYGPPIVRQAVHTASKQDLPELTEWIDLAEEMFPDSVFTRIDVENIAFYDSGKKEDFTACINYGERWLQAIADREAGRGDLIGEMYSSLYTTNFYSQQNLKILLAGVYAKLKQDERAFELLNGLDFTVIDHLQTLNLINSLVELYLVTERDLSNLMQDIWCQISEKKPTSAQAQERLQAFCYKFSLILSDNYRQQNPEQAYCYRILLPLLGKCELGTAAAVLESDSAEEISGYLRQVEDWNLLPESALYHALELGVPFPLPDKLLTLEEMDSLAIRLSKQREKLLQLALETQNRSYPTMQELSWARALTLAAVQTYSWKDGEKGAELARAFTALQKELLFRSYSEEMLRKENVCQLPSMLRFGWYCIRAFEALDAGDPAGYVRRLREGLAGMPAMKEMVEFLAERSKEVQELVTPPELLELAEQVRMMLAVYPANDPAVAALKQSEAYQKVAYLLEQ